MRRLVRLGAICAFVCALSLGLFAACGGNEPSIFIRYSRELRAERRVNIETARHENKTV